VGYVVVSSGVVKGRACIVSRVVVARCVADQRMNTGGGVEGSGRVARAEKIEQLCANSPIQTRPASARGCLVPARV
jgi:hypothetical protein